MNREIRISRPALKDIGRLDAVTERRVRQRLRDLSADPYAAGRSKPLTGVVGLRSSRVGGWRILFRVNTADRAVEILAVRPRGDVYRQL